MAQLHASAAPSAETAARTDFAPRRQPRGASSASDDGFAAILDRSNAQRIDALRQLRQGEEAAIDETAATDPALPVDPATRARKPETAEQKTQPTKPQRSAGRDGDATAQGDDAAARARSPGTTTGSSYDSAIATEAKSAPAPDTTTPAPTPLEAQTILVVVPQLTLVTPPQIQNLAQGAQVGIGAPMQPGFVAPLPAAPVPGTTPALPNAPAEPMGPDAPADPVAHPAPTSPPIVPMAPTPPAVPPATMMQPPQAGLPTAPTLPAQPAAAVAPQLDPSAKQETTKADATVQPPVMPAASPATQTPQVAAPNIVPTAMVPTSVPDETAPAAMLAAATLVEASQPQRMPGTRPDALPITAVDDTLIDLPFAAAGARPPIGDDAGAAARGATARSASGASNAVAAQLAQNDDGAIAPVALPPTTPAAPPPLEPGRLGAELGDAKIAATEDDVAPVRHAIVMPAETAGARIESTSEAVAARAARLPMHPAIAQVAVSVTKAVQEGVDRITIKLQPPELGRIDVRLEVGVDGRIQAVFAAERPATVEILQRDVRELERALQNAGLSTDSGSLSFGLKQNGGQNGHAFAAFERNLGNASPAAGAEDETALAATRSKRVAADGRLDIHV